MTITFLFPHPVAGPTGGYKVVYEYANRLVADGYNVRIVYSGSIYWSRKTFLRKLTCGVRYLQKLISRSYSCKSWFPLDSRVREIFTLSLNQRHVPESDIYVATSPYTAYYLNQYSGANCKKFYLIQDYEDWGPGLKAILHDTYHYPMQKIVISQWLQRMLREDFGEESVLIPNGFDFTRFYLTTTIAEKNPLCISMLYHVMERKDCAMGFRALEIVKKEYPQLRVILFGVSAKPADLPSWFDYHQSPSAEEHNRLNNEAAIYVGTSRAEGWGLTVGEAMMCGQAVCCTDNAGYREMAIDGETALLSPPGDAEAMAQNVLRLIADEELRQCIAKRGYNYIQRFKWDESYSKLKSLLNEKTSNQGDLCDRKLV